MKPNVNQYFSHFVLRDLVLAEQNFMLKILGEGKNTFKEFIKNLWIEVEKDKENVNAETYNTGIKFYSSEIDDDEYIIILTLPTNIKNKDSILVAFNFGTEVDMKYFTYEYIQGRYFICQWLTTENHNIIEETNSFDKKEFIKVVMQTIINQE